MLPKKARSYRQGVRDSLLPLTQRLPPPSDDSGGNAERQGDSTPHWDSNNASLKGAITKRPLEGAMPANTSRLTDALTLPIGKVLDVWAYGGWGVWVHSLINSFIHLFIPRDKWKTEKAMICSPFADPLPINTYSEGEPSRSPHPEVYSPQNCNSTSTCNTWFTADFTVSTFCAPEQAKPRKPSPQLAGQNAPISLMHLEHHLHIWQIVFQQGKAFTPRFETEENATAWKRGVKGGVQTLLAQTSKPPAQINAPQDDGCLQLHHSSRGAAASPDSKGTGPAYMGMGIGPGYFLLLTTSLSSC